jgi:ubiquinone/menaquinone biosynthesis C-methylase UbiE
MEFNNNFLKTYLIDAPLPLALERTLECNILSKKSFPRPILDIGCGEGLFAKKLFKEKIDVGIDPNPKELRRAKSYDAYDELIQCKGDRIPKKDGLFNTIFSNSVLEHIPEIDSVLAEAHRLLSAEGTLYLTLPTNRFEQYTVTYQLLKKLKLGRLQKRYAQGFNQFWAHYHCYSTDEWSAKFKQNGFEVVEVQEYASKKTCLFNALSAPCSIIPFITKKTSNRWIVLPAIRRLTSSALHFIFKSYALERPVAPGEGGLVFFSLKKESR